MKQLLKFALVSLLILTLIYSFSVEKTDNTNLRYDQITFKASHNSYERNETISDQLTFNPSKPYNSGCMSLEFDIWRHSSNYTTGGYINSGYFTVAHNTPGNTPLSSYLSQVKSWHNANPNHYPVLITLDIKSKNGGYSSFHNEIDTYLKRYFGESLIFKPNQLMTNPSLSLCANVVANGWPKLSDASLKGKFIFCLSGNDDWKTTYANTNLNQRTCFSDQGRSAKDSNLQPPTTGNFVFFNFHIYNRHRKHWLKSIPRFAAKKLITRAYIANSDDNWNNSIKAKVSAIATDKIRNHSWAKVSNTLPFRQK